MYNLRVLLTFVSFLLLPAQTQAESTFTWAGTDATNSSYAVYTGAYTALSGQDIYSEDGWLLRGSAGFGEFDYDSETGDNVNVNAYGGDIMLGHSFFFKGGNVNLFVGGGVEYRNKSSDDPAEDVNETNYSLKLNFDTYFKPVEDIIVLALGSYSTSETAYFSHISVAYDFGILEFGPTIGAFGDDDYLIRRVGASLGGINLGIVRAHISGGYQDNQDNDKSGYLSFGLGRSF